MQKCFIWNQQGLQWTMCSTWKWHTQTWTSSACGTQYEKKRGFHSNKEALSSKKEDLGDWKLTCKWPPWPLFLALEGMLSSCLIAALWNIEEEGEKNWNVTSRKKTDVGQRNRQVLKCCEQSHGIRSRARHTPRTRKVQNIPWHTREV